MSRSSGEMAGDLQAAVDLCWKQLPLPTAPEDYSHEKAAIIWANLGRLLTDEEADELARFVDLRDLLRTSAKTEGGAVG